MRNTRSPFLVIPDFVSPLTCEEIVDKVHLPFVDQDENGRPVKSSSFDRMSERLLSDYLVEASEFTEEYYGVSIRGVHPLQFESYPEGCSATTPSCENSIYMSGKWSRSNNKDFVGILFLTDYQERAPFDPMFEVKGGKLQFPTHGFGFNPKRGMLVIFPGNEYFVYNTSAIEIGDLHQVKIHMTTSEPYVYNPDSFPGNYEVWFR